MEPEIRLKHVLVIDNRQELLSALNQSRMKQFKEDWLCGGNALNAQRSMV